MVLPLTKGKDGRGESQLFGERNLEEQALFNNCLFGGFFNKESKETTILGGFLGRKMLVLKELLEWSAEMGLGLSEAPGVCPRSLQLLT